MNKFAWIVFGFCLFLALSAVVVSVENVNFGRRVKITGVNFAFRNNDKKFAIHSVERDIKNIKNIETIKTNENSDNFYNRSKVQTQYTNQRITSLRGNTTRVSQEQTIYKNLDDSHLDKILSDSSKYQYKSKDYGEFVQKYEKKEDSYKDDRYGYGYDNIDWSRWKSNFVNRILDDSIAIPELDEYPNGAFFYYSFIVDYTGAINSITVRSLYLSESHKKLVVDFIKSYEHKPITRFPKRTKRKTARVSAIMMLSSMETIHSKPSDFNDTERVKYQIKR